MMRLLLVFVLALGAGTPMPTLPPADAPIPQVFGTVDCSDTVAILRVNFFESPEAQFELYSAWFLYPVEEIDKMEPAPYVVVLFAPGEGGQPVEAWVDYDRDGKADLAGRFDDISEQLGPDACFVALAAVKVKPLSP